MEMALNLAEQGRGYTSPNPMVGAVAVKEGRVIGRGYHQAAGGPHAEVNAIDNAGEGSEGATLYVTLEPCNHTGRTPPCTRKILEAGIRRVVVAADDPNPDVKGRGAAFLKKNGVAVTRGILKTRAVKLNEFFNKYITTKRPFVIAKCASTLDGRTATRTGNSKWITGEAARAHVHQLRHAVDGIMVGIGTVRLDDPSLTARVPGKQTRDPVRIILDSRLDISEKARLFHLDSNTDTLIICGDSAPREKRRRMEKGNVRVLATRQINGRIDLHHLMDRLGEMEITSLLIEGGSRVLASAFRERIVDKCAFYVAPKILGGDDGFPMLRGPGPEMMADCIHLDQLEYCQLGEDILIQGYVKGLTDP